MSLKAIKEALAVLAAIRAPGGPIAEIHTKASAEIAALEKAAKIVARATEIGWPTTPMGVLNLQHSFELLANIAMEAE